MEDIKKSQIFQPQISIFQWDFLSLESNFWFELLTGQLLIYLSDEHFFLVETCGLKLQTSAARALLKQVLACSVRAPNFLTTNGLFLGLVTCTKVIHELKQCQATHKLVHSRSAGIRTLYPLNRSRCELESYVALTTLPWRTGAI
jgi:hypothetical protein